MSSTKSRIGILDGFRSLAIFAVVLFHFFSRFVIPRYEVNLYPYKDQYDFFGYGWLGVEFFFIISGFVIFFTLEFTDTFTNFWKKRFIRLWPSMLIASVIIFTFFRVFGDGTEQGAQIKNFIPSLLFVKPDILNNIFDYFNLTPNFFYLNGSFWSLWAEIQFYAFVSIIYFINKKRFIYIFLASTILLSILNLLIHNAAGNNILHLPISDEVVKFQEKWFDKGFILVKYLPHFAIGVVFYLLFKNHNKHQKTPILILFALFFLMIFVIVFSGDNLERLAYIIMYFLFGIFIFKPQYLSILEKPFFTKTGVASYFLYLIHENIGVFIIVSLGSYFLPYGFVLPLLLIVVFTILSVFYTNTIDKKINKFLKSKLLKK